MLQQDGKLSLAEPLATWFPRVTSASDVRLEDVLSQVSGYRDYYPLDYVDLEMSRPASEASIAKEYGRLPLTAEPRTRWEYSNTNYLFAGLVAERVSGLSLGTLQARRIFAPLEMTRTFYDEPYRPTRDRATGYDSYFTETVHTDAPEAPNWLNAAGSIAGTAGDLARWDIALMRGSLLDERSTRAMMTERILMPGAVRTRYGLGEFVTSIEGHRVVFHTGAVMGFASANVIALDDDTAVAVLTNVYEASAAEIARNILRLLVPAFAKPPAQSKGTNDAPSLTPAEANAKLLIERGLKALRSGVLARSLADPDFARFLNAGNAARADAVLARLGSVRSVTDLYSGHRGGFNFAVASVLFTHGKRTAVLFATPAGKISELFLGF